MTKLLKIAKILDKLGKYKEADKLEKKASILLMAIELKENLEDGIRALYNYYDERTLTKILKDSNILQPSGDVSNHPFDYNELIQKLTNIETISPQDLPTKSGRQSYNNLQDVKNSLIQTINTIDKLQMKISPAHEMQREKLKEIQNLQGDIIPDE
jgi:hypothetical protein